VSADWSLPAERPRPVTGPTPGPAWARLVAVERDGSDGTIFPLTADVVELGRGTVDLSFRDDAYLSPRHARVERRQGNPTVVPLDRVNGVFRRIRGSADLAEGDAILAGRQLLVFEAVRADERTPTPMIQHGVVRLGSLAREPWGRLLEMLGSGAVRDVRHLSNPEVVIGREEGDLIFRDDEFLSRRHAALRQKDGRYTLVDLGSSNGTYLRLHGAAPLVAGDHLRFGNQLLRYEPLPGA
jgi:pSer/pThr/pTyr-binding forkhead associated (FHA) protein